MIVVAFLLAVGVFILWSLAQAFVIILLIPYTGIAYDPSYWQAFALAILINVVIARATASASSS